MNKNAIINTRTDKTGKIRTETARREDGSFKAAIATRVNSNSTALHFDLEDGRSVHLTGRQARTLLRLLNRHYDQIGKSDVV